MRSVSKAEALEVYKDNEYKTELISNLEDGTITFCDHADFFDLCRGGHIPNTGIIKAFKIFYYSFACRIFNSIYAGIGIALFIIILIIAS